MSQHATGGAAAKTGRIFIGDLVVAVDDESVLNKTVSEVGMVMPLSPWAFPVKKRHALVFLWRCPSSSVRLHWN